VIPPIARSSWNNLAEDPAHADTKANLARWIQADRKLPDALVDVESVIEADGTMTLRCDGEVFCTGQADGALKIYPSGLLEIGKYQQDGYPAVGKYDRCERFPGRVEYVRVIFGAS
jgi:hypothetical protein